MNVQLMHETFKLLPEGALYWPRRRLIALSDIHIGKAASLQRIGVPVPGASHHEDFGRMAQIIRFYRPRDILILGDLIHHKSSWSDELLTDFTNFFISFEETRFTLIEGNHERGSEELLRELPINISYDDYHVDGFSFAHGHRQDQSGLFRIEGHVHPLVELREGPTKLRLKCFIHSPDRLLLPAFGALTGGYVVDVSASDQVYAIANEKIISIPSLQFFKGKNSNIRS